MAEEVELAEPSDMKLRSLLWEGASYVYAAHGVCSLDEVPPIGREPPGTSLQQFWHLGPAPVPGWSHLFLPLPHQPDFNRPEVSMVLRSMMAVRRMSRSDLDGLVLKIQMLPNQIGRQDGGFIAATLLARLHQAITEPTAFPPLLTNAELRMAYAEAKGLNKVLGAASEADSTVTTLAAAAATAGAKMPDHWAGRVMEAIANSAPGRMVTKTGLGLAQTWSAFKKIGFGAAVWIYSKFILGRGATYQAEYAQAFRDEMIRRGLPAP